MTNTIPPTPTLSTRSARHGNEYPAPGTKLGAAWAAAWRIIAAAPTEKHVGSQVAKVVAEQVGVAPVTVSNLLARFAGEGVLERSEAKMDGTRGPRLHASYRLPPS